MSLIITKSNAFLIRRHTPQKKSYLYFVFPFIKLDLARQKKACKKKGILIWGKCVSYGEWGGRLIAESGKINRDVVLLKQKQDAKTLPFMILAGEFKGIGRWPKLSNKPLYLFDELSLEARNFRVNTLLNFNEDLFFQINYQFDTPLVLDAFLTWGNFDKSPFYLTVGLQYLPYGDFSKFDVEVNSLNKTFFRIDQFGSTLGYKRGLNHLQLIAAPAPQRLGIAYEHTKTIYHGKLTHGLAYLDNIVDGNIVLQSLTNGYNSKLPAADYYAFYVREQYQFHLELTSALKPIQGIHPLLAYNIEAQYRFVLLHRQTKLIVSTSGLSDDNKLKLVPNFNQRGIFSRQYVLSLKRRLFPHMSLGLAGILGKKREYEKQFALNLIVKV